MNFRAVLLAATLLSVSPKAAAAQEWGCGGLPAYELVSASGTRMIMHIEIATTTTKQCLGVAARVTVPAGTKYRVLWLPCVGQTAWRFGGDSSTMAKAFKAALKPKPCPVLGLAGEQ